jgi:hypothetical protein
MLSVWSLPNEHLSKRGQPRRASLAYGNGVTLLFAAEQAIGDAAARALPGVAARLPGPVP